MCKINIFFSHFEGTRGEETKYFAPINSVADQSDASSSKGMSKGDRSTPQVNLKVRKI